MSAVDGRVLRGERTRAAIVDALLDLLNDGELAPTSQHIADRAGVSVRSIFQHFEDIESLYGDLARAQADRTRPLFETIVTVGDRPTRIANLSAQRSALYERITPVRHALGSRTRTSPAVRRRLDEAAALLRAQVARQFAQELTGQAADVASQLLDALDLLWSFDSWDRLRTTQHLSAEETVATLRTTTDRLLR